jgi:thiol:disulfide interchange protein DsbD
MIDTRTLWIWLLIIAVSLVATPARGEPDNDRWQTSESDAFTEAMASGRHVLVVFGADWCLPCLRVDEIVNDTDVFDALSRHFVPLHFDITELSDDDEALQTKYRALTLPAVIFVDTAGRELGRWTLDGSGTTGFIVTLNRILAAYPNGVGT